MRTPARALLLGVLIGTSAAAAVALSAVSAQAAPTACPAPTSTDLASYFDEWMPTMLGDHEVPGAVVSVVSGGDMAFAGGYGLADLEHDVPFDPSRSLVRVGSVTKLLTWTAVMQQVEAGRLDLEADVNTYLDGFQIPATFPQSVTLLDLMNHTAGFEEFYIGTYGRTGDDVPPLRDYLASHLPARIRPPGQVSAYSNYGAGLAGYIVERVSGEPYDQYVRAHILDPLGMRHSSAAQPLPAGLAGDLARSYDSYANPPSPLPHVFDMMPPDGALATTATDMAKFMNAHLHDGDGILAPGTAARMHQRSFTAAAGLDGYAHGFKERTINGHHVLMHDGGEEGFRSAVMLVPDCDLGVFVSMNGTSGEEAAADFTGGFFDQFVPATTATGSAGGVGGVGSLSAAAPQAGFYLPTRHNESTVGRLNNLLSALRLTVAADGTVRFRGRDWSPADDGTYHAADGTDRLVFLISPDGRRYVATDGPAYQLVPGSQTLPTNLAVLLIILLPAGGLLVLPLAWAIRRLTHRPLAASTAWRTARLLAAAATVVNVGFLVALFVTLIGDTDEFLYGVPIGFRLLLAVPLIGLAAGVAAVVPTVRGWRGSGATLVARVHQVTLFVALVAFVWFIWQWNLIGWQYA